MEQMFDEDTKKKYEQAVQAGVSPESAYKAAYSYQQRKSPQVESKKGNLLTSKDSLVNVTNIGGVSGAVAGAGIGTAILPGIGTVLGGIIGGMAGSASGEYSRQKFNMEKTDTKEIAKQGIIGGASELGGAVVGKVGGKLLKGAGKLLTGEGENLALKSLGIPKGGKWLTEYAKKHGGEDAMETLAKNKLIGMGAQDIEDVALKPLQDTFDNMVTPGSATVDPKTFVQKFVKEIETLRSSPVGQNKQMAKEMEDELYNIIDAAEGGTLDISEFNKFRKQYDVVTRDFAKDPALASKNRKVGSILRETVQETADKAGLQDASGKPLKEVGKELSKLYDIHDRALIAQNAGRGGKFFGLGDVVTAGAGGVVGGIPGAAATLAGKRIMENPKVLSFLSKAATNTGKNLEKGVGNKVTAVGGRMISQSAGRMMSPSTAVQTGSPQVNTSGMNVSAGGGYPITSNNYQQQESAAPQPLLTQQEIELLALQDLAETGGKNLDALQKYSAVVGSGETKQTKLSDTAIGTVNDLQASLDVIGSLEQEFQQNPTQGPIMGRIRSANPYDTSAQGTQAKINLAKQIVGKALEGGVLRKEDEEKYAKILPTIKDTPAVAAKKLENVKLRIQQKMQEYTSLQNSRGSGQFNSGLSIDPSQAVGY
jgi:hypothetical protein